jgi:hypothetical protein
MKVISSLEDKRIKSFNILVEFTIGEYLEIAGSILDNNPFQRKRVKSSSTVYSLLREDLKAGCVIPPIVLAITQHNHVFKEDEDLEKQSQGFLLFLKEHIQQIIILDGLQRTYNIIDANSEILELDDIDGQLSYFSNKIRCEFYLGINKIGILYRMLTLNTGQTPMSLRHQIEILYSDYLNYPIDGIKLIKEIDDKVARKNGEYSFKEIIEGFTSYLMRDYLTFDKTDILSNIKSLEKLSEENQSYDIFQDFTKCYNKFQLKTQELSNGWELDIYDDELQVTGLPYGKNAKSIFDKSQSMTGLGSAVGFLKDKGLLPGFDKLSNDIERLHFANDTNTPLINLLNKLDDIRKRAPKIGNAQRAYFYYFFRELFNPNGDSYLVLDDAIENAFTRYSQNA